MAQSLRCAQNDTIGGERKAELGLLRYRNWPEGSRYTGRAKARPYNRPQERSFATLRMTNAM
jgi:hypothetical protein